MGVAVRLSSAWTPALLLLFATTVGMLCLMSRPSTAIGATVAAIFPPWWTAERSFAAAASAEGAIVRTGVWSNILVLNIADADLPYRLRTAGAFFLVNPVAVGGCLKEAS
jgi:hypothetical protein